MKHSIKLMPQEQALLDSIELNEERVEYETVQKNGPAILALLRSLGERNAIPKQRLKYWSDPTYHIGRIKSSHKGLFERNNCTGEDIYTHPHFLKYLRYFLFGADLPPSVIEQFEEKIGNPQWFS